MIDHFGINVTDMEKAGAFYDRVLGVLGHRRLMDFGTAIGYGTDKPDFWISTFEGVGPNREMHLAFQAPDAEHVRAFVAAAVEMGAEVLHEPRLWPEYHERYFGGFVRDTEGNNVEAVCHTGDETSSSVGGTSTLRGLGQVEQATRPRDEVAGARRDPVSGQRTPVWGSRHGLA